MVGHRNTVRGLAFSPDGRILASGAQDDTTRVWDVATGRAIAILNHPLPVLAVAFSPDGRTLASGDAGGRVQFCTVSPGTTK
jgi:WD40 repeat protein